ncbi:FCGR2 protein, partial [Prunella fulvescens]|nr:FCGR2 protein [Prunella fulvescens]
SLSPALQWPWQAGAPVLRRCPDPPDPCGAPWTPAVLWDWVTLTCQGSGTAGATTWYKDGRCWWQERPENVTKSGTYTCDKPGSGQAPLCESQIPPDWLVLQMLVWVLLEGDTVTLRCRG